VLTVLSRAKKGPLPAEKNTDEDTIVAVETEDIGTSSFRDEARPDASEDELSDDSAGQ
jgi:hypothetical protein